MCQQERQELAMISNVGVGMRDAESPIFWFTVSMAGTGALMVFRWDEASKLIKEQDIDNVFDLNGKCCVVSVVNNIVEFVRLK